MDRSEAIQSQFGASASRYASSRYHSDSPDLDHMLRSAVLEGHEWLLDVGTGAGHTAVAFAPHVTQVVAIDLTDAMLDETRAKAERHGLDNVRTDAGCAMNLPYAAETFDVVTCRVCAHHFADADAAVREAARVLKPGGQLLVVDTVSPDDAAADTFLNCIELVRDHSHVRNYQVGEWLGMMRAAGLDASWVDTFGVVLEFDDWFDRMQTPELARAQLRAMFDRATDAIRETLAIRTVDGYAFDIPIALFRAVKPA